MADLPINITTSGLQPRSPAEVQATLLALVAATNPGYTANLPGILIEDISSTDVAAILQCDSALVELVNSLSPRMANAFLLTQLGQMLGITLGAASNTSVFVVFTGPPGFVIGKGFIVSDGTYQYVAQESSVIGSDGTTPPVYMLANLAGTWAVPAGTVTNLITSTPSSISLTVVNPLPGIPGSGAETQASYRSRVLQANLAASQGMARYLRTLLDNVEGVQSRLVNVQQVVGGGWLIIVGGGDPYYVANAIWTALFDISLLEGSTLNVAGITQANPAVVSTFLNHGFAVGNNIEIASCTPTDYNGSYAVNSVPTEKTFSLGKRYTTANISAISWSGGTVSVTTSTAHGLTTGSSATIIGCTPSGYNGTHTVTVVDSDEFTYPLVSNPGSATVLGQLQAGIALFDSTGLPPWVSGGVITPNPRNVTVSINDYPDTYVIPYVNPPLQTVTMTVEWDTISPNLVSTAAVAQVATAALVEYVNSINVGHPMNVYLLQSTFLAAVSSVVLPELVSVLNFSVSINGIATPPDSGTGLIEGDPQSYFYVEASGISVVQAT